MVKDDRDVEKLMQASNWCVAQMEQLLADGCCVPPEYRDNDVFEYLNLASLCIEKQIPRQAEVRRSNDRYDRYYCPFCHKQQSQTILGKDVNCERCGQRLYVEVKNVTEN